MELIESYTLSKSGIEEYNEDGMYFKYPFAAVIDGTTSKGEREINGMTCGRFAMQTLITALDTANPDLEPFGLISWLNQCLKKKLEEESAEGSAGIVLYNAKRRELIVYGDNFYRIDGKTYKTSKKGDVKSAKKRAKIIKRYLTKGYTVESIQKADPGRTAIIDDIKDYAHRYANRRVKNGYAVLSGQEVVKELLKVHKIAQGTQIILASDGYPILKETLAETENMLSKALSKDVLCIKELLGTKGVAFGNISFDDRTYLRFKT